MDSCFREVYKGKRVLVTGHTGFKGGWLSLWLKELGAEVLGYALEPPTNPCFFDAVRLADKIEHVLGDIRDEKEIHCVIDNFRPEFIFHLAAQPLVRLSYKEPRLTYETNIMGTINLLETIRKADFVKVVVNITSDKCYENKEWVYGYRESDPMGGNDPYSSSKGCAEIVTSAYRRSFFSSERFSEHRVALSSVRAGNVIGGGDWGEDRLVPDCMKALSDDRAVIIRNPNAIRPWQHILEVLSGYLWLGALMYQDGPIYSGAWNFGPTDGEIVSVEELVKLIINYWGKGTYSVDKSRHPHEANLLKLDCSRANSILEWKAVYNLHKAINETVCWYKEYYDSRRGTRIYDTTINQILRYISHATEKGIKWSAK